MIIPVDSPSPYSVTPVNAAGFGGPIADAMNAIASMTGSLNFPASSIRIWNDPCMSAAVGAPYLASGLPNSAYVPPKGSGRWQFIIEQEFFPAGSQLPITFQVHCQGNATISAGGFRAAPCPTYPITPPLPFTLVDGPMFTFPSLPAMTSPGNTSIMRPRMLAVIEEGIAYGSAGLYSLVLSQFRAAAVDEMGPGGTLGAMFFYTDPQTSVNLAQPLPMGGYQGYGTGQWKASVKAWTVNAGALSVFNIGGCSIQMQGGPFPTAAPVSWAWGGYTTNPQVGVYDYYLYYATQLYNDFSF